MIKDSFSKTSNTPERMLLIEDDYFFSDILRELFTKNGFAVDLVVDIEQISALDSALPYKIIICDYHLPGIDGSQLLKSVRTKYSESSIICLSGAQPDDADLLEATGVVDVFLKKPCSRDELLSITSSLLMQHG